MSDDEETETSDEEQDSDENTEHSEEEESPDKENENSNQSVDNGESNSQDGEGLDLFVKVALGIGVVILIGGLGLGATQLTGFGGGDVSDFDYPDGANETGFENVASLRTQHAQTLGQDSFTLNLENTAGGTTAELTYKYDDDTQLGYRVEDVQNRPDREFIEDYENQEVVVVTDLNGDNTTYERAVLQQQVPYTANFDIGPFIQSANYEAVRTTQTNGENAVVYESQSLTEEVENQTGIQEFNSEVHLTESGYFALVDVDVTTEGQNGETVEESQVIEVTNVGDTTVEEPEWLETAIEETEDPEPREPPQPSQDGTETNETDG